MENVRTKSNRQSPTIVDASRTPVSPNPEFSGRVTEPKGDRAGDGDDLPFETFPEIETVFIRFQPTDFCVLSGLVLRNGQEAAPV